MKPLIASLAYSLVLGIAPALAVDVAGGTPVPVPVNTQMTIVKDEGLWPLLLQGPNKTVVSLAFNQPKHGASPGEVDAWISEDEGKTWSRGGSVAPRPDAESNRMNLAAGFVEKGTRLVAAISGYTKQGINSAEKWVFINPVVTESRDGGRTWREITPLITDLQPTESLIPFGALLEAEDGSLRFSAYHIPTPGAKNTSDSYMLRSTDGGKTWNAHGKIGQSLCETGIIRLKGKEWLAIARTTPEESYTQGAMRQFRSIDDGATWTDEGEITPKHHHPANIIRLADGRLLLSYSIRTYGSIVIRLSEDEGKSWGRAMEVSPYKGDGGYPASVQLADGSILTAFYGKTSPSLNEPEPRYHSGLVNWNLP